MSDDLSVEGAGETVGEAKWAALRELERLAPGIDRDSVRFQVVTEGERGLLGVGTTPARVVASAPAPAPRPTQQAAGPAPGSTEAEIAVALLDRVATALRLPLAVEVHEADDEVVATATGGDAGVLIGRHGQMLDALQVLANAVAHTQLGPERRRIVIDAADYRDRRRDTLLTLARRAAEQVAATGRPVTLDPMSAAERRIVHESLKDDPEVDTTSEGAEPHRAVVVVPRHAVV